MIDLTTEIKQAMLAKQPTRLSVLRALKTAIATTLSAKGRGDKPLTEDEEVGLIRKQIAQRVESITSWEKAGRTDRVAIETEEKAILEQFLPAALSDEEILFLVQDSITKSGATTKKDMGAAMKIAKEMAEGRVDPKVLSGLISAQLS
jgi:uncharacterized protein YqeY